MLSLAGAGCSIGSLWLACRLPGKGFGPVSYSILATLAHMTGQFTLAWLLFIPHPALWRLFPVLITAALLFGIVSGIIAGTMTREHRQCRT
jgi:heptaprenyl diphosphate synthase